MKFSESKRNIYILGLVILIGIICIGIAMLIEANTVPRPTIEETTPPSNDQSLRNEINNLRTEPFSPSSYSSIAQAIESSYQQSLITNATKASLEGDLINVYSDLVYNQCNLFLSSNSNYTSSDVLLWLQQIESIIGNNSRINYFKDQIRLYIYFSETLPRAIGRFLSNGFQEVSDYEQTNISFRAELKNMPNFDARYSTNPKFNMIRKDLTNRLEQKYIEFQGQ
jgi:hypothetical protein